MLRIRLFGGLQVELEGKRMPVPASRRSRSLLAWIALNPGLHPRARLAPRFWPNVTDASARASLRTALWEIRAALGTAKGTLVTTREGVGLDDRGVWVDARAFEELARDGKLGEALALADGELLADLDDDWVFEARDEHRELRAALLGRLAADAEAAGDLGEAVRWTRAQAAVDRLREVPQRELVRRLGASGERAAALAEYRAFRDRLWRELRLVPSAETVEVIERVRSHETGQLRTDASERPGADREPREERKLVTALVAELAAGPARDPEDVRAIVDAAAAVSRAELERRGAVVEPLVGGRLTAYFGVPAAGEDDAARAVQAALAVRDAAGALGSEVRIGVATDAALVALDSHVAVAGVPAESAARAAAAAPAGAVLVGERTVHSTRDTVDYRRLADGPLPLWEALAVRPGHRSPADEGALVGRQRELRLLREALAEACAGRGPYLVTLIGVPGIGKTRLVRELAGVAERAPERIAWREGRSPRHGGAAYAALAEIVKAEAGILETDDAGEAARKLHSAVGALVPDPAEARWVEERVAPLVGMAAASEPERGRADDFAAWRRLLEAIAERQTLALVFEDLQWADDALLDFVDELVERAGGSPLLVVATARAELLERRPGWGGGKRNARALSLAPLADDETARLIEDLLAGRAVSAQAWRPLIARAGGNPLYAREYARLLADRAGREAEDELPLPDTVQAVIAARLDALPPAEKALLQDGAVIGEVFSSEALAALAEGEAVAERLLALERKELVRRVVPARVAGEQQYAFAHALVREVAYEQLPRALRARKHRAAAGWAETLAADGGEPHAEMLAHHYLSAYRLATAGGEDTAGLAERARAALTAAGDRARALHAAAAAARCYDAALELWPEAPASERAALVLARAEAELRAGETHSARDRFRAVLSVAREAGDGRLLTRAALGLARLGVTIAKADPGLVALLNEALAALGETEPALRARLLARLAVELYYESPREHGQALSATAVELARRAGERAALAAALNARHVSLWDADHLPERLALADEMLALAQEAADREQELQARNWRFLDLVELADVPGAKRELEAHDRLARELRLAAYEWYGPLWRSMLALLEGRLEDAERLAEEARALGASAQEPNADLFFRIQLFHLRIEQGRPEAAPEGFYRVRAESSPTNAAWRSALAYLYATRGDEAAARRELAVLGAGGLGAVPRDVNWLTFMTELAETAVLLGDAALAGELYELLLPYAAHHVSIGRAVYCFGSAAQFLGALASLLRRWDDAEQHFRAALETAAELGARPALARTQLRYAQMLAARGGGGDAARARDLAATGLVAAEEMRLAGTAEAARAFLAGA